MVGIGTKCFLQFPDNSKTRVLHPVQVVGLAEEVFTVESEESGLPACADMEVLVYFEKNREFMQQSAKIENVAPIETDAGSVPEGGPQLQISFRTTGEPVSAESRQTYRVSAVVAGYKADLNVAKNCSVLDVSSTGLSVVCEHSYSIGNVINVSIIEDGQTYSGEVCVQSVRDLGNGRIRYGLHCVSDKSVGGSLGIGLQRASMRFQREQLRRLAGSNA